MGYSTENRENEQWRTSVQFTMRAIAEKGEHINTWVCVCSSLIFSIYDKNHGVKEYNISGVCFSHQKLSCIISKGG